MLRQVSISFLLLLFIAFGVKSQIVSESQIPGENVITVATQLDNKNAIELYPNPTVDFLIVHIKNSEMRDVQFEVRSLLGSEMMVEAEPIGGDRYRFPVKDFTTGYYFIIIEDEETRYKRAFRFLKSN